MEQETEFWKQFAGSGTANILTIVAMGFFYCLKKLCDRPSKCKSHIHCCCCDLDVFDKNTQRAMGTTDGRTQTSV